MAERIFQLLPISAYDVSGGIILIKMLGEKIIRKITNQITHYPWLVHIDEVLIQFMKLSSQ